MKKTKKLTKKDFTNMWGDDSPYSQVRLCEEVRILGGGISRVFLVVEAEINPFTFEYVSEHREAFSDDQPVLQLLDHADFRGEHGYVVAAGEVEIGRSQAKEFSRKQAEMTTETLIRMHKFVMAEYGIGTRYTTVEDKVSKDKLVWNEETSSVEKVAQADDVWEEKTVVGSPARMVDGKTRMFVVLPFDKGYRLDKKSVTIFGKTLQEISAKYLVDLEGLESFLEYMFLEVLIPLDVVPAEYIEEVINKSNKLAKNNFMQKDYLITNTKKPSIETVANFLTKLPLGRDELMS